MVRGLSIERLSVRSLDVDRKELSWEIQSGVGRYDSSVDPRDFTFQIYRSESPEGPFAPISGVFEDQYLFVDSRIPSGHRFRQLWYRIQVTHKASSDSAMSAAVTHEAEADLVAKFIRRSEQTLFTQVIGRSCWLLKRRTFGPRCPSCWDEMAGKRSRSNCRDCFDTGFLRGYHDPIQVWVQVDPESKAEKLNAQMVDHEQYTTARLTFYPNVNPKDVLVEAENVRWRVVTVQRSERLRAPIKQELQLRRIQETDMEYGFPINLDRALKDIQPSPARMFTMPADVFSAIDEQTPNVFANYDTYPTGAKEE